ncbi:pyridoxamine 5'-phosphate oxidase family protein [Streptomyces sp. GbtcB6]|uniref:pyridoxamine 5'-phosphate oxidase family protein n=1 Tax=Streptomyces sp. GbtcB6 TaxID=2824751 RepID=UPI001C30A581|nr:pyridoxamine 5'-phosphate oxidase family protein [Streptomyces sp. GbtcB6]
MASADPASDGAANWAANHANCSENTSCNWVRSEGRSPYADNGDTIVIRTHNGSALVHHTSIHEIMVYEADHLDRLTRAGWSVMVTWRATAVASPLERGGYCDLLIPCMDRDLIRSFAYEPRCSPATVSPADQRLCARR